jgi:hypothetical protein
MCKNVDIPIEIALSIKLLSVGSLSYQWRPREYVIISILRSQNIDSPNLCKHSSSSELDVGSLIFVNIDIPLCYYRYFYTI